MGLVDRYDVAAVAGLALVGVGLWLLHPAAALMGVGGLLLAYAVVGARNGS
jgi:hypothetical protein